MFLNMQNEKKKGVRWHKTVSAVIQNPWLSSLVSPKQIKRTDFLESVIFYLEALRNQINCLLRDQELQSY